MRKVKLNKQYTIKTWVEVMERAVSGMQGISDLNSFITFQMDLKATHPPDLISFKTAMAKQLNNLKSMTLEKSQLEIPVTIF